MEKEKFMSFEKALEIVRNLSRSQGFYGRLLQTMERLEEEQQKELELDFELNKVKTDLDLIFYFEC